MRKRLLLSATAMAAGIACGSSLLANNNLFYASVYSTNEWKEYMYNATGLYSFPLDRYDRTRIKEDSDLDASGGGTMTEDFYFCTKEIDYGAWVEITHYAFDPDSWELKTQLFGSQQGVATDLAYDHTTAKIFGCFSTDTEIGEAENGYVFGTINEGTGQRQFIKAVDTPWIALGCSRQGQLYAVDMGGALLKVDKINGNTKKIADLGFTANRRSTGAIDTSTGIFYVVVTNEDTSTIDELGYSLTNSQLYAVDVTAGTASKMYDFADGEAVAGMYIPGPLAADDAPAAASSMTLNFEPGALNGTISFKIPEQTFGGTSKLGAVKYLIRANGALFAQGTSEGGATVNAAGKVDTDGQYEFTLELTNDAGRGPKTKASQWIGHDTPVKLSSAVLAYNNGAFTLSWQHPAETEHGGYMDQGLLTYDVTRLPDNVKVATATHETSVNDPVAIPETMTGYSYRIDMSYRGKAVNSHTTDAYNLGTVALPFAINFDDENAFDQLTVIDSNGDKAQWYHEEYWYIEATDLECGAAMYPYSSTKKADDWLILPALKLEKGTKYTVEFQVSTASKDTPEKLAVSYGVAPAAASMTESVMPENEYAIYDPVEEKLTFTPAESGMYHIGFHACSEPDGSGLALRNLKVDIDTSSIDSICNDDDESVTEVYNLQGVKVGDNAQGGIFIEVRANGKARKVKR